MFDAKIYTEGKTDSKHLKKAFEELRFNLDLEYHENNFKKGDVQLYHLCDSLKETSNATPQIFIFDQDNPEIIRKVSEKNQPYKYWRNNVYSFILPVPAHRKEYINNICIEFYYTDEEIKTKDDKGNRLYLTSEFNPETARHIEDSSISYGNVNKLKDPTNPQKIKILDDDVFDKNGKIALSKNEFADYIVNEINPFNKFNFINFNLIKELIEKIVKDFRIRNPVDSIHKYNITYKDHPPVIDYFIGRENLIEKLLNPSIRVAAITGLAGEGKSSLAAKIYNIVSNDKVNKIKKFAWSDCKDLETPFS